MSGFDYNNEIKHSIGLGLVATGVGMAVKHVINNFSLSPTFKNAAIGTIAFGAADYIYDYGKFKKWWPWM